MMLAVGDGGTILRSGDGGATWTSMIIAGAGDFHGVTSDAWAGLVLAVDSRGGIWSSGDTGVTWAREAGLGVSLDAVNTTQAGAGALAVGSGGAGEAGTLLTSTDLGAHWTTIPLGTTLALYALQDL
jgi:photosystem II stability/assembly factor-like uncharacterized protein